MPATLQARFQSETGTHVFATLVEGGLSGSTIGLATKHGSQIPGRWSVLGVVDALPDDPDAPEDLEHNESEGILGMILGAMLPILKVLGRPSNAYGVTPLIIFREVDAR